MRRPSDRDAYFDRELLKAEVQKSSVRTMRIADRYFGQDWSAGKIAIEIGLSEGAVRSVIRRVRRLLRRKVENP